MIYLGLDSTDKDHAVNRYCVERGIKKIFLLTPEKFPLAITFANVETIEYNDIIEYKYFYRLLQEINNETLVVINECLRTQNRYDLTYNCIRNFLNQTKHQMIFQYLPIIDSVADFMVLFDFDTRSRWKREQFNSDLMQHTQIGGHIIAPSFNRVEVATSERTKYLYAAEKKKLIKGIGLKDPHTIPRNLYLFSGKEKLAHIDPAAWYIGRNNRFKLPNAQTYKEGSYPHRYTVFEFCHNFIDFIDFMSLSKQSEFHVLVADLKVDEWYFQRYQEWRDRLNAAYAGIYQRDGAVGSTAAN